jgi:5'-3' exonuclease
LLDFGSLIGYSIVDQGTFVSRNKQDKFMTNEDKKRVLIIDALNMFIRAYIVDPSLSTNGQPIGGIKGTIKIMQTLTRLTNPDEIVVVWDGPNGSQKRRSIDKGYKEGRKPLRLNRSAHNLSDDEIAHNKMWQTTRVIEYFNEMPIVQIMLPEIEADDVISYVTQMKYYKGWQKVVASNDKDFLQLCDDETLVYRPTSGALMNKNRIIEEIGIHPRNMALARAIAGDVSDNLPGIKGAGLVSIKKRLGFLASEKDYTVNEVIDFCEKAASKLKFFINIAEGEETIAHNYKMMQLYSPLMSVQSKSFVRNAIENFECTFNKTGVLKLMHDDGFGELNWEDLKASLNRIEIDC